MTINKTKVLFSPVQLAPFQKYPGLQVHTKDPSVFSQVAFALQLCVPVSHSFLSAIKKSGTEQTDLVFLSRQVTVAYHTSHFM